ncbi:NAD-dependent deacylase [Leisingera aquaemixtae]|uniref:NAD-dependent deacylase n=1 Tax=Leisingera aquaemixtae TaxID=1396826 RepID=UPI001C982067|nr:NAD-dependent deacylase [Leisingera aquaemixtae]MBY6066855.1 NAD-dependent deacylase [Leisingera aquaemixtae]
MGKSGQKIVILTGAGISAESGLGTFRDEGGLWAQHRIEDVATPEAFARNPDLVHGFYNARRAQAAAAQPNPAHQALARLQAEHAGEVVIVTQNVDALHEAGGAAQVLHMHGTLAGALCAACGHRWPAPMQMQTSQPCPACAAPAVRPDVVWFGEFPYFMEEIYAHLAGADLFAAIGTSGEVYPAAAFVDEAHLAGAHTVELNLEPSATASRFAERRFGPASETVPAWVAELLG